MRVRKLVVGVAALAAMLVIAAGGWAQAASARLPASSSLPATDPSGSGAQLLHLSVSGGPDLGSRRGAGSSYHGLFPMTKAALSPYDSLTQGGSFLSAAIRLASNLHFRVRASTLSAEERQREMPLATTHAAVAGGFMPGQTNAAQANLSWTLRPWARLSLSAGEADENANLIGGPALARAHTSSVGMAAHLGLGDGWVTTFAYRQGSTQLALKPAFAQALQNDRSYGVTLMKQGLFSRRDAVGLAIVRPGNIYTGGIDLSAPMGVDLTRTLIDSRGLLVGGTTETDLELGYVTTFFDGALALQANAGYQMNVAGRNGNNAVTVLSRAKINF